MSSRAPLIYAMTGALGVDGGIAAANRNVLRAFAEVAAARGRSFAVLSLLESGAHRPPFLDRSVDFEAFGGRRGAFARRLIMAARPGALVGFDHVTLALPLLPAAMTGLVRTVIFTHGAEAWKRVRRASVLSLRAASLCLANSEFTLRRMRDRLDSFRGQACLLGLPEEMRNAASRAGELPPFTAVDGTSSVLGDRVLLAVARFDPAEREKGHDALVRAMPSVLASYPTAQLVMPGPGADRERIHDLAVALDVGASVFLPGRVSDADLDGLYERCFAFVLPSTQEGFGLVYVEAMSHAKACVACRAQGAEEVIADGETGILIGESGNPDEVAASILQLLRDPELTVALGRRGRARYEQHFTPAHHRRRVREALMPLA